MHAFLTGSTGFIGRRLAAMLRERGDIVTVAKRGDDHFRLMQDAKPDVVFHLAAHYVRDHEPVDVARLVQSNVEYGAMILEAMRMHGVRRIVATSTLWVWDEPVNLYAATKLAFEAILKYYADAYGIQHTLLYLGDTYGPEDRRSKIVYKMFEAVITEQPINMTPGEQVLDLVHVDDVCLGLIAAAGRHHDAFWRFSLHGEYIRLNMLAAAIREVTGKPVPVRWGARPYHPREVMMPARWPSLPNWAPSKSLLAWLYQLAKEI